VIIEEILKRKSIRQYLPLPVEREKLERIMEAGRMAPTAKNLQEWTILVIEDIQQKLRLVEASSPHQLFLKQAAILLAACSLNPNHVLRCGHPAFLLDLAIVLDHISLQAVREGLGTCWIGSFDENRAKAVLGIPDHLRIVQLMSLGYPEKEPAPTKRKPASILFRWNQW
jgi:nitroreductase